MPHVVMRNVSRPDNTDRSTTPSLMTDKLRGAPLILLQEQMPHSVIRNSRKANQAERSITPSLTVDRLPTTVELQSVTTTHTTSTESVGQRSLESRAPEDASALRTEPARDRSPAGVMYVDDDEVQEMEARFQPRTVYHNRVETIANLEKRHANLATPPRTVKPQNQPAVTFNLSPKYLAPQPGRTSTPQGIYARKGGSLRCVTSSVEQGSHVSGRPNKRDFLQYQDGDEVDDQVFVKRPREVFLYSPLSCCVPHLTPSSRLYKLSMTYTRYIQCRGLLDALKKLLFSDRSL
jgi:hypothetical protein